MDKKKSNRMKSLCGTDEEIYLLKSFWVMLINDQFNQGFSGKSRFHNLTIIDHKTSLDFLIKSKDIFSNGVVVLYLCGSSKYQGIATFLIFYISCISPINDEYYKTNEKPSLSLVRLSVHLPHSTRNSFGYSPE